MVNIVHNKFLYKSHFQQSNQHNKTGGCPQDRYKKKPVLAIMFFCGHGDNEKFLGNLLKNGSFIGIYTVLLKITKKIA